MTIPRANVVELPRVAGQRRTAARPARAPASITEYGARLVLFYLFVEYVRPEFYLPAIRYVHLGIIATCAGAMYLMFSKRNPIPPIGWAMLIFIGVQLKTVPFAPNQKLALFSTLDVFWTLVAGPLVIMTALSSVKRLRRAVWFYSLLGAIMAIQALRRNGCGVGGFFTDENDVSMLLSTIMPIAYFLGASASSRKQRLLGYGIFVLSGLAIVQSFSRGGFLALIAVGLFIILRSRRRVLTLLVVLIAVLIAVPFVPKGWLHEMQTIETADQAGDTGEIRIYMWGVAWKIFLAHPIMGVGTFNFTRAAPDFQDPLRHHLFGRACHSTYFTLLSESGVPGTLVWLTMVGLVVAATLGVARRARIQSKSTDPEAAGRARDLFGMARGIEGGLVGFLVSGAFLTVNYYPVLWTLAAFAAALSAVSQQESPALEPGKAAA